MDAVPHSFCPNLECLGPASNFAEDIYEIMANVPLFKGLSYPECAVLCEYMQCYGAPGQVTLFEEGERGDALLVILTGEVKELKLSEREASMEIAIVGPGGTVGEISLIDGQPWHARCICSQPTDFSVLDRAGLNGILRDHPRLGNKLLLILLQQMARRLRASTAGGWPATTGSAS